MTEAGGPVDTRIEDARWQALDVRSGGRPPVEEAEVLAAAAASSAKAYKPGFPYRLA